MQVEDIPAAEIEWRPELSVFDDPTKFGYHIFTTSYDRTVEVADLPAQPGAVERLVLGKDQVRDLLLKEIEKREQAATEFDRLGEAERANALRTDVMMTKRYVED